MESFIFCAVSGIHRNYILLHLSFFSTSIFSLMMYCVRLLSELMILLSTQYMTKCLTCRNKFFFNPSSCQQLLFDFEVSKKICFKDLKFLRERPWNFANKVSQIDLFNFLLLIQSEECHKENSEH